MHHIEISILFRTRREVLQVTQMHLAELSGVGLRTIKAIERGTTDPRLSTLNKLADVLGLSVKLDLKQLDT